MTPTHAGLTADMFVLDSDRFLVLKRAPSGRGGGIWYLPGGLVEPGEEPLDAAVRETFEESGLLVTDARILRVWAYPTPEGHETTHATFVATAPHTDVALSVEHTAARWITPRDYITRYCSSDVEAAAGALAPWVIAVRHNCELVAQIIGR